MVYTRVIFRGTLPDGEVWSTSCAAHFGIASDSATTQSDWNDAALRVAQINPSADLRNIWSTACTYTGVRLEKRHENGSLIQVAEAVRSSPITGQQNANKPFQISLVLSLLTDTPSRSGRGRMYLPALAATISPTSLRMSPTATEGALSAASTWVRLAIAAMGEDTGDMTPQAAVHSGKEATTRSVTRWEMGDVLDVQRRRRDKAIENRYSTPA